MNPKHLIVSDVDRELVTRYYSEEEHDSMMKERCDDVNVKYVAKFDSYRILLCLNGLHHRQLLII